MSNRRRIVVWGPVVLWMGVIFFLSGQSRLPKFPLAVPDTFGEVAGHLLEYAVLAVLVHRALRLAGRVRHPAVWAFVISVLYGITDEFHQTFVPGRDGNPVDVVVDGVGAGIALTVVSLWRRNRSGAGSARDPAPDRATSSAGGRDPNAADRA